MSNLSEEEDALFWYASCDDANWQGEGEGESVLTLGTGERPACQTCIQNKHECAGYGDDPSAGDSTKENSRDRARPSGSSVSSNAFSNAPSYKAEQQPIDPQLTRPHLPHTISTVSQNSDASIKRDDDASSHGLSLSTRNRMPYFRYFGPTAIMPGFKQMVVKVRGKQHGSAQTTSDRRYSRMPHCCHY